MAFKNIAKRIERLEGSNLEGSPEVLFSHPMER
jgi:hypothetical protein